MQATDTAGNVSVSDVLSFTLDTVEAKPVVALTSDTGSSSSDDITSNAAITVSGQDVDATLAYKVDGAATFSASYVAPTLDGHHTVQVQATDTAGNVSVSDVLSFTLDTVEAKPVVALTSDTGSSSSDDITSNAAITVSGQDVDATLAYKVDGAATFSASYVAPTVDGHHTVQVQATDTAGNVSVSDVLSFTLDTVEAKPVVALTSDTGSSSSDDITSNAAITVSGQDVDATLAYKVDGAATFSASYVAPTVDGHHTVQVQATDTAGNVSVSDVLSFTLDTVEAKPVVALTSDTGSSSSDDITSNAAITVSGQDVDATLAYKVDGAATFSASYVAPTVDGHHTVQVQATDTAGNVSVSDVLSFTLDTVEAKPVVALTSDTGSSSSDDITSNAAITVTGQDVDATLAYKVDGAATFSASYVAPRWTATTPSRCRRPTPPATSASATC